MPKNRRRPRRAALDASAPALLRYRPATAALAAYGYLHTLGRTTSALCQMDRFDQNGVAVAAVSSAELRDYGPH